MVDASKLKMHKESTNAKCAIFLKRENAKTKFLKSGKCECNFCYTHLSSFSILSLSGYARLVDVSNSKLVFFFLTETWLSERVSLLSEVLILEKLQLSLSQALASLAKMMHLKYRGACA